MKALKHALIAIGICFAVISRFIETSKPGGLAGWVFAPQFETAKLGYETLLKESSLSKEDSGFQEVLALVIRNDPKIANMEPEAVRLVHIVAQEIQFRERRPRVGSTIHVEIRPRGETPVRTIIWEPEKVIQEMFFELPLRKAGSYTFWVGIGIATLGWLSEVLADRRRRRRE